MTKYIIVIVITFLIVSIRMNSSITSEKVSEISEKGSHSLLFNDEKLIAYLKQNNFENSQSKDNQEYLIGGYNLDNDVKKHNIKKSGGVVNYHIYGGYSQKGFVKNNKAKQSGGITEGTILGGFSEKNNVQGNKSSQSGGKVYGNIYGGYTKNGIASHNIGSNFGGELQGYLIGGLSENGDANFNEAFKGGGSVHADVIGGVSLTKNANNNLVTIHGDGTKGKVIGGSALKNANNNRIIIEGITIEDDIIGGLTEQGQAVNNTVELTIRGGGKYWANWGLWTTVPDIADNVTIYGGFAKTEKAGDVVSGNTLVFHTFEFSAKNIKNFSKLVFNIPKKFDVKEDYFLTLLDPKGVDLLNVNIVLDTSKIILQKGDKLTLLKNNNNITFNTTTITSGNYTFSIAVENNVLVATVIDTK